MEVVPDWRQKYKAPAWDFQDKESGSTVDILLHIPQRIDSMDLASRYLKEIERKQYIVDPAQQAVIDGLCSLKMSLDQRAVRKSLWSCLGRRKNSLTENHVLGCYIWGGVGRGKSWLMDLFLTELNAYSHARMHYQEFMRQVHLSLKQIIGQKDPLSIIAQQFAHQWKVVGLDEFDVVDITDAMLWHGLIKAFRDHGTTLIITSNRCPEDLYKEGLQRQSFLPVVNIINQHMDVIELTGDTDYRQTRIIHQQRYYYPADDHAEVALRKLFQQLVGPVFHQGKRLVVNRRQIDALHWRNNVAWFDFMQLCHGPRSASDYLELSQRFRTVFVSKVPVFYADNEDQACRFIQLIDEFYDQKIQVFISAQCEVERLYQGRRFEFEFRRTISRLHEMQSTQYTRSAAGFAGALYAGER